MPSKPISRKKGPNGQPQYGKIHQIRDNPKCCDRNRDRVVVDYTIVSCSFGSLLVTATTKGLCAVALGDDTTKLESFLRSEFPGAEIICDQLLPNRWVDVLLEYLNGSTRRLDIPLDLHGTEFQRRVWEEIRAIPYGTTRTYSEVASAAGQPAAVRATASACAANPVSLAVPCHRVVRKDGTLGGYGWGLERKSKLLQMERDDKADN